MITASHNPVDDSGLKIFTKFGYKTTPEFELELSRNAISLSQEEREIDQIDGKKLSEPSISFESPLVKTTSTVVAELGLGFSIFTLISTLFPSTSEDDEAVKLKTV